MLIRVMYQDDKFDMVKPLILDGLIASGRLKKFFRLEGWATIGIDPIRGRGSRYEGPERRNISTMKQSGPEEQSLMTIDDKCEYLTLADGSNWHINPDDMLTVYSWISSTRIRIAFIDNGAAFPYELTNIRTNVSVKAMKI